MKKLKWLVIVLFAILLPLGWYFKQNMHKPITVDMVESITLWGSAWKEWPDGRLASKEEEADIVAWFNDVSDIRGNKSFGGSTPEAGVTIQLAEGARILILKSGNEFEIQRQDSQGKTVSYWAKEKHLSDMLTELAEGSR